MLYIFSDQMVQYYYMAVAVMMMPVLRIFIRAGLKPYWALLLLVPWVGYIFCACALAFRKWPAATVGPLAAPPSPGEYQP